MRTLRCKDAGFECDAVVKGNSDDEVMDQAAVHAREVHGIEPTPEMDQQLRSLIREE